MIRIVVFAFALLLAACSSPLAPPPTPDPRIDELQGLVRHVEETVQRFDEQIARLSQSTSTAIDSPSPTPSATSTPSPTPTATSTPSPTPMATSAPSPTPTATPTATLTPTARPTPGLSLQQIKSLIEESIATAIAAIPTQAPGPTRQQVEDLSDRITAIAALPTSTPGPTLKQIERLIEDELTTAIAAIPTPRPLPTPTPVDLSALVKIIPQLSASSQTEVRPGILLTLEPGQPLAGRDVLFTVEGLRPWQRVTVEYVDPRGSAVEWILESEARFTPVNGVPVTQNTLFADGSGSASWVRVGFQDQEGVWSVRLTIDEKATTVTYPVSQLQVPVQRVDTVGVELRLYQGGASDTHYSARVPATLAVDFQTQLAWVSDRIQERLNISSREIPDIYLLGNETLLKQIGEAIGHEIGLEFGFFLPSGPQTGIYLRTDSSLTTVQGALAHEYVHLLLDELTNGVELPAWLNEGLAEYMEYELGLEGARPHVGRRYLYLSADRARDAAAAGQLVPLAALENQSTWNAQRDEAGIRLQYAEAHMAVRYLIETYGTNKFVDLLNAIASGSTLRNALTVINGVTYDEFRDRFATWLEEWADPDRAAVAPYILILGQIIESQQSITDRRAEDLVQADRLSTSERLPVKRVLVADAEALRSRLLSISPPASLGPLHQQALSYLDKLVQWLTLELAYVETGQDRNRIAANEMIPEIDARDNLLVRSIGEIEFSYQLP